MRSRPWILVLALITVFFALVTYHGWSLFKANERIKNYLISQLKPVFGDKCEIDRLDMALGAVHLKEVDIKFKNSRYELWIDDLRIGYNFFNLIKSGFKPQKSPQDILFVNPKLTINQLRNERIADNITKIDTTQDYWNKIREFDFLKRVTVSKGIIVYKDSLDNRTVLAEDISGWISTKQGGHAKTRLVGKLFRSDQLNLRMNGEIDLIQANLDSLEIDLMDFQWREKNPFFIPDYLDIKQGTIYGKVVIKENFKDKEYDINGSVSIKDGAVTIQDENLYITDINLTAEVQDYDFIINKSDLIFNGSVVSIEGKITDIFNPVLNLKAHSDSVDIEKFQQYFHPHPNLRFAGNSNLTMVINQSYLNPLIKGYVNCPQLYINKTKITDVKLKLMFENSILTIDNLSSRYDSLIFRGKGKINFSQPDSAIKMIFAAQGNLPEKIKIGNISTLANSYCRFNMRLEGNFNNINGDADIFLKPKFNESSSFFYKHNLNFQDGILTFSTFSNQNKKYADGIFNFNNSETNYELNLVNIHEFVYQLPEYQLVKKFFNFDSSKLKIKSEQKNIEILGDFKWKNGNQKETRSGKLSIKVKDNYEINSSFFATFGNQHYEGNAYIIIDNNVINIKKLQIDDIFNADGVIGLADNQQIQGKIKFTDSDINHLYNLFVLDSSFINRGALNGTIDISGKTVNPFVKGELDFDDSYINQIGIYHGKLTFNLIDSIFTLNQLTLNKDENLVFKGQGNYFLESNKVDFQFQGDDVDLNNFVQSLANKKDLILGKAKADLRLIGSINRLRLTGSVDVGEGRFSKFHFDSLYAELGELDNHYDRKGYAVEINKLLIIRKDQFEIIGSGLIPFTSKDMMNIDLVGEGNLLSVLPEIQPFFKETASTGHWQIHFTGNPDYPIIESGNIQINNGYLRLGAVAPEINNITANIKINPDGFVHVEEISGEIKKRPFKFSNQKASSICCKRALQPFMIPDWGLNFGVFSVETSPKGIPLHIPGLMNKGEIGNFEFISRDSCEKFYFAGPVLNPVVRGAIRLRNFNFMYPFKKIPGMGKSPVVKVLKMTNWDVKVIPSKDTRYEKQIPSGVDKVYASLLIDSGTGWLDFSGIIEDSTFFIEGWLESSTGIVDYLDFDFRIEKAGVEFDKGTLLPIAYGRAKAIVADSMGVRNHIFLTLLLEDEITGHTQARGRWGKVHFQLSTDNPNIGRTEAEILATLGYSGSNIREKATDIIGISTDNLLFRPLYRPVERKLERTFNLDLVKFSSRFARNFIDRNLWKDNYINTNSNLYLLSSSRLIVGKYLADKLFVSYTGQLESGLHYHPHGEGLGLKHTLGLEYRINSSLLLEMEYNYNSFLLDREEKRIFLRHSFPIQ